MHTDADCLQDSPISSGFAAKVAQRYMSIIAADKVKQTLSAGQVYYPDEVKFWNGIVVADNRDGGEAGVQEEPYSCGGLWERYTVTWDSTVRPGVGKGAPLCTARRDAQAGY